MIPKLINYGADVNKYEKNGMYIRKHKPIHYSKTVHAYKLLVSHGADPDALCSDGTTLLFTAVFNGHYELVKYLLDKGVDIYHKDNNGKGIMHFGCGNTRMWNLLFKHGADINDVDNDGIPALLNDMRYRTGGHWFLSRGAIIPPTILNLGINVIENNKRTLAYYGLPIEGYKSGYDVVEEYWEVLHPIIGKANGLDDYSKMVRKMGSLPNRLIKQILFY